MAWCDNCLSDHDGPCLDVDRSLDYRREVDAFEHEKPQPCPFCGGRGRGGPFGYAHQEEHCSYCAGSGKVQA